MEKSAKSSTKALPEPEHLRLIEMATHIAAIAIGRARAQAMLRESERKLKEAQRIANISEVRD